MVVQEIVIHHVLAVLIILLVKLVHQDRLSFQDFVVQVDVQGAHLPVHALLVLVVIMHQEDHVHLVSLLVLFVQQLPIVHHAFQDIMYLLHRLVHHV